MTKIEQKFFDLVTKYLPLIAFIVFTILAVVLRLACVDYESDDFRSFLNPWFAQIQSAGIEGLKSQVGNYNIPYQILIYIMTLTPFDALDAYKLLSVLFDFGLAISSALVVREYLKCRLFDMAPVMTYSAVLLALTAVMNSSFWAQCDSIYTFFIVLAIYFTMREKYIPAFVMLGASLAFKLQMVFILPLFLYYWASTRKISILHFSIIPAVDIVMCLPVVFMGRNFADIIKIYVDQTDYGKQIQMNYPNIYAFMCDHRNVDNYYLLKGFAVLLTLTVLAAGMFLILRKRPDLTDGRKLLMTGIWSVFTCLMFLSSMHERYAYLLDVLLLIYLFSTRRHPFTAIIALMISLRGYCYYLFGDFEVISLGMTSIVNIGLYIWISYLFIKEVLQDKEITFINKKAASV